MSSQPFPVTFVVPGLCPKRYWWPILHHRAYTAALSWILKVKRIFFFFLTQIYPDLSLLALCSGIFGYSGFYHPIKKFSFPFFDLFSRFFPQCRAFGALLSSAQNALTQTITTSLSCQRCGYRHIFRSQQIVDSKIQLDIPSIDNRLQSIHALDVPLSPTKAEIGPTEGVGEFPFLSPFLSLYFQQLLRTLFVFSDVKIEKGRQRFTIGLALCSDHIPKNVVSAQSV